MNKTQFLSCRVEDVEKLEKSPLIAKEIPIYGVIYHCEASVCAWQACMTHPIVKAGCQCLGLGVQCCLSFTKGCPCTACASALLPCQLLVRHSTTIALQTVSTSTVLGSIA